MTMIRVLLITAMTATGLSCASSHITTTGPSAADRSLPQPSVVLVYDFAVFPEDVIVDTLGAAFMSDSSRQSEAAKIAYATANALSEQLVVKLLERGIPAECADASRVPPLHAIVLKGQFLTIDAGSRAKRMMIGLGAGSTELRAHVQAYQATPHGLVRIADAEAEGSKMPGMAIPLAGGAALGNLAASAVISGGMNIVKETRVAMDPDAERMATQIADRAEAFYQRQGWQ